jgi:hypothetical protein
VYLEREMVASDGKTARTIIIRASDSRITPLSTIKDRAIDNLDITTTKMKTPLRIAILECDTPPPAVVEKYGRYDRIFTTLLETAAEGLGLSPKQDLELSAYDVVTAQEYPDSENIDAVLISGSSEYTFL